MSTKHVRSLLVYAFCFILISPAANAATAEEEWWLSEKFFNEGDVRESAVHLRLAAEQNHLAAQNRLGEHMWGSDDYEEAFGWFLTAAFQGDAAAQFNLGQQYANGTGTEPSPEKALYWAKKSAEQNYFPAVEMLSVLYAGKLDKDTQKTDPVKNGYGIAPNQEQADFWKAKLPELQKNEARRLKRLKAEQEKKAIEEKEKRAAEEAKWLAEQKEKQAAEEPKATK